MSKVSLNVRVRTSDIVGARIASASSRYGVLVISMSPVGRNVMGMPYLVISPSERK